MNVWHDNPNPLLEHTSNIEHLLCLMHREQMELQYHHSADQTARAQMLFVSGNPIPNLSQEFVAHYGLTIEKWIHLCWLCYVAANNHPGGLFCRRGVQAYEHVEARDGELDVYFSLASRTPEGIRQRFRQEVLRLPPEVRFLARSVFLETPIMDFDGEQMLAPHSPLLLRAGWQGTYRLMRQLPSFGEDFGASVQRYVGRVLGSIAGVRVLLEPSEVEHLAGGNESCDYIVELENCVLLVECKATTFVAMGLLEDVIRKDGSTGKVAKGMVQVCATAHMLSQDAFLGAGISRNKPVVGIVATFGELPLVNSDWYFNAFILKREEKSLVPPIYPSERMKRRPIVLSLQALENLVVLTNTLNVSPDDLYAEKETLPYIVVGDWLQFTMQKLRDATVSVQPLPFVRAEVDNLFADMTGGASMEH